MTSRNSKRREMRDTKCFGFRLHLYHRCVRVFFFLQSVFARTAPLGVSADMRNKRSRKVPLTSAAPKQSLSHKATQATISNFHTLLKQQAKLRKQLGRSQAEAKEGLEKQLDEVERSLEQIGGIHSYQIASQHGQSIERGGDSAKVLLNWLSQMGYPRENSERMR